MVVIAMVRLSVLTFIPRLGRISEWFFLHTHPR
jgi:hypothetical protein